MAGTRPGATNLWGRLRPYFALLVIVSSHKRPRASVIRGHKAMCPGCLPRGGPVKCIQSISFASLVDP